MLPYIISLFNHKGGVSKTTTAFNLGWALADLGQKVMLVDADPQCNLTGITLDLSGFDDFSLFYQDRPAANLYAAIKPAFAGQATEMGPADLVETENANLFLLAGHLSIADYEAELSMATKIYEAMPVLQNLPGAIHHLIKQTAAKHAIDFVLIDTSPSIGALNQNLVMQSDYFMVPTSPDFFCAMAVDSLARILPIWHSACEHLRKLQSEQVLRIPDRSPKFIGMLSQRFRPRQGKPAKKFAKWIDLIAERVEKVLVQALLPYGMTITKGEFEKITGNGATFEIAQIADFNSLIAQSQLHSVPIFALSNAQLGAAGVVEDNMIRSRDQFRQDFNSMAVTVINLCHGIES